MIHKTVTAVVLVTGLSIVLVGCSSRSIVTLTNGSQMQARATPKFDKKTGFYLFDEVGGKAVMVNKDEVQSIKRR